MLGNTNNKIIDDSKTLKNIENKLSALIALTAISVFESSSDKKNIKPEIVLHNAGLEKKDIANILGKNLGAVIKTIQRTKPN